MELVKISFSFPCLFYFLTLYFLRSFMFERWGETFRTTKTRKPNLGV